MMRLMVPVSCSLLLTALVMPGCGRRRIDVDQRGEIKLRGERPVSIENRKPGDRIQRGTASWYGRPYHGRKTANGERYDMNDLTAAHKTLPFGTRVTVVHRANGKRVGVRINDRGPFIRGRIIDLSRAAAERLGMMVEGVAEVELYLEGAPPREPERNTRREAAVGKGYWTVQVGSYSTREGARAMAARGAELAGDVRIEPFGSVFRVRMGRFREKTDTFALARALAKMGIKPWILFAEE